MTTKLINIKYLRRSLVFTLDVVLSTVATLLAYIFMFYVYHKEIELSNHFLAVSFESLFFSIVLFRISKIYKEIIRHFSIRNIVNLILISLLKSLLVLVVGFIVDRGVEQLPICASFIDFLLTCFFLIGTRSMMVSAYYHLVDWSKCDVVRAFIYSTRGSNPAFVEQINKDANSKYHIKGFLTTNEEKIDAKISGENVYFVEDDNLQARFKENNICAVIFTSQDSIKQERGRLVEFCINNNIKMLITGSLEQLDNKGNIPNRTIQPIQIEDLLERDEINIDFDKIRQDIKGKVVMVTGVAGSIGSEIARQVATYGAKQLIAFDVAETPLHNIQLEFTKKYPDVDIKYTLGDVRSMQRVKSMMSRYKPSIIFHAAAYKHVPMVESNPCEGVLDNVWGTVNLAQQAIENGVEKFVMISTDKAVNPTNVMGATKRIAEMCVQRLNKLGKTEFITTRFGNVLGSNGSVIPHFKAQIAAGGPVTVTHPEIIRYFMTIPEACRLVLQAATMGHAGEIMVFDMGEQVKIVDLARKMIQLSGFEPDRDIKIEFTGLRPGEKLYEELLSNNENTTASQHEKIRIAKSVTIDETSFNSKIKELIITARKAEIENTVVLMKKIVPEFKSNNSVYVRLDKKKDLIVSEI